ncbi:MAG: DegV family protein [Caldiserica bacterium]|jgi:DegV family protein with EDD domain|nr:DegV family protein [Caldisericota bacterium]MDH7561965.1 DegV family protein [Caldisericota bacterium]
MSRVAVLTDSTSRIPEKLSHGLPIFTFPLVVTLEGKPYREGVDISLEEFYKKLPSLREFPTTSRPAPEDYIEAFKKAFEVADSLVVITISSGISATYEGAVVAAKEFPGKEIEVIDSQQLAMAHGWQVVTAARAAKAGLSFKEVVEIANLVKERSHVCFMADTLDYLYKGGRISGVAHLVGSMLKIKPVVAMEEGKLKLVGKVRSRTAGIEEMISWMEEALRGNPVAELSLLNVLASDFALELKKSLSSRFGIEEGLIIDDTASVIIGAHCGPGTSGPNFYSAVPGFRNGIVRFD